MLTIKSCHWAQVRGGIGVCIHPDYNEKIAKLRDIYTDSITGQTAYMCPNNCPYYLDDIEANMILSEMMRPLM